MPETTLTDALTIQREMFAAVQRGDMKVLRDLLHPGYSYTASDGVERPGPDAGVAVAELYTTAFPDLTFEEVRSWSPTRTSRSWRSATRGRTRAPSATCRPPGAAPRASAATSWRSATARSGASTSSSTSSPCCQLGLADG